MKRNVTKAAALLLSAAALLGPGESAARIKLIIFSFVILLS